MGKQLKNPKEAIYIAFYDNVEKPKTPTEVSEEVYGYRNPIVSTRLVIELLESKWLIEDKPIFKKGVKKDGRRTYYKSTTKGIIDTLPVNLNRSEKHLIEKILDSKDFRYLIKYKNYSSIKKIIDFLLTMIIYSYICNKYHLYIKSTRKNIQRKPNPYDEANISKLYIKLAERLLPPQVYEKYYVKKQVDHLTKLADKMSKIPLSLSEKLWSLDNVFVTNLSYLILGGFTLVEQTYLIPETSYGTIQINKGKKEFGIK